MIRTLTVSNYRSLGEDVQIHFDRFTVLVGPNGSGKSNAMDALRFVADTVTLGLAGAITARHGIDAVRRWSGGHPFNVAIRVDLALDEGTAFYAFELTGSSAMEYEVKSEEADVLFGQDRVRFRVERGTWIEGPDGLLPPWIVAASRCSSSAETSAFSRSCTRSSMSPCTRSSPTRCARRSSTRRSDR